MMTTKETITEIERLFVQNGNKLAVLRPIEKYNYVDWLEVTRAIGTDKIDSYTQTDKIVIEA